MTLRSSHDSVMACKRHTGNIVLPGSCAGLTSQCKLSSLVMDGRKPEFCLLNRTRDYASGDEPEEKS